MARLDGDVAELPIEALLRAGACTNLCGMEVDTGARRGPWPAVALSADTLCSPSAPILPRWAAAARAADVTRLADVSRSPPP